MSDLIERLRQLADNTGKMTWVGDMPMPASAVLHLSADRIAELEAENARLKEALQKIADIDRYWRTTSRQSLATGDTHYDDVLEIGRFGKIASAALKETIHD